MTGLTLAPPALKTMAPDALLANLATEVAQARTLRWISNDAVPRSVADKLQGGARGDRTESSGCIRKNSECAARMKLFGGFR